MAVTEVDVDELETVLQSGVRLIDVREVDEYHAGHVPGAVLVPLSSVPVALERFRGPGPTYVICRTGARSYRACEYLEAQGIHGVNVAGGTLAWLNSGRDVVTGDQPA